MKIRFLVSLVAAFAVTASAGFAQSIEATPAPKPPKPNFAPFKFMVGTWTCNTKSARRPAPYETTTTYAFDPSGYWLVGKSTTKPMAWFPYESSGEDRITYDSDTGRWIDVLNGDFGGYDLSAAKGWSDNQIVWHDIAFAKGKDVASQTDFTLTKVSDTKMTGQSSFTTIKNRSVGVTQTCVKES
jgi:hypothetical protein